VFSTIALLGYVFNFSVLYSNYAIEALYSLVVFNKRVDQVVVQTQNFRASLDGGEGRIQISGDSDIPPPEGEISTERGLLAEAGCKVRAKPSILLEDVSAVWSTADYARTKNSVVTGVSLRFDNYEKVAVIGRVGCGKTTLLSALMKEAFIVSGRAEIKGSEIIGYAEQSPVIVTGTVRSNILYGSKHDQEYYDKVVEACQLVPDFASFPQGDLTETGEMGISLSGGQKSRISLARALYKREAKILLIDGTLSSLDARVSSKIMHEIT